MEETGEKVIESSRPEEDKLDITDIDNHNNLGKIVLIEPNDEDADFQPTGINPTAADGSLTSAQVPENVCLPLPPSPAPSSGIRCKDPSKTPERILYEPMEESGSEESGSGLNREPDLWSPALSRALRERYVGNRTQRTPRTLTRLMQQHRENERHRHRSMIESIHEISQRIPGYNQANKETKIVKLQRIINYVCHLEGHLQTLCDDMGLGLDLRNLFLTPHISNPNAKKSCSSRMSAPSTIPSFGSGRHIQAVPPFPGPLSCTSRMRLLSSVAVSARDPVLGESSSMASAMNQMGQGSRPACYCTPSTSEGFLTSSQSTDSESGPSIPWDLSFNQDPGLGTEHFHSVNHLTRSPELEARSEDLEWLDYTRLLDAPEPSSDLCSEDCDHMLSTLGMDSLEAQLQTSKHNVLQLSPEHLMPAFTDSLQTAGECSNPGCSETCARPTFPFRFPPTTPPTAPPKPLPKASPRFQTKTKTMAKPRHLPYAKREMGEASIATQDAESVADSTGSHSSLDVVNQNSDSSHDSSDLNAEGKENVEQDCTTPAGTPIKHPSPYRRRSKRKIKLPQRSPLVSLSNILKTTHQRAVLMAAKEPSPVKYAGSKKFLQGDAFAGEGDEHSLRESFNHCWGPDGCENPGPKRVDHRRTSWMNGFMMYSFQHRRQYIEDNPGFHTSYISKLMGQDWRRLSAEDQKPYWDRAKVYIERLIKAQSLEVEFGNKCPNPTNLDQAESEKLDIDDFNIEPQELLAEQKAGDTLNLRFQAVSEVTSSSPDYKRKQLNDYKNDDSVLQDEIANKRKQLNDYNTDESVLQDEIANKRKQLSDYNTDESVIQDEIANKTKQLSDYNTDESVLQEEIATAAKSSSGLVKGEPVVSDGFSTPETDATFCPVNNRLS